MKITQVFQKIKRNQNETLKFDLFENLKIVSKTIKSINPRKAAGPDGISVKILKTARNIIDSHLTNIKQIFRRF